VNLELLLTDGFFNLVHDLEKGKVNPSFPLDAQLEIERETSVGNFSEMLAKKLQNGEYCRRTTYPQTKPSSKFVMVREKRHENLYEYKK